jgi:hypothetical protein
MVFKEIRFTYTGVMRLALDQKFADGFPYDPATLENVTELIKFNIKARPDAVTIHSVENVTR